MDFKTRVLYRGPIVKDNLPKGVLFEDLYFNKDNLYYEQIYRTSTGSQYKVKIRINAYEDQSDGTLFVLRPTGWIEYIRVQISLLVCSRWSRYQKDIADIPEALSDFREDAMSMICLYTNS